MQQARENHKLALDKIKELYLDYHNAMITIPNNPLGMVFEDGVENKNPNYKIDILTNLMHQIGYFESMRVQSENLLRFMLLEDREFDRYHEEQEEIKVENARSLEKIKIELFKNLQQLQDEKKL